MKAFWVLSLDYGSAEQIDAADKYWNRFMAFFQKHPYMQINEKSIDDIRRSLLFFSVFYQANRRWLAAQQP